jgi:L-alanine-DL-glutamate epimerase-like enolase superfamily enzyme
LREKPVIEDGHLVIPDGPGFGVELADDLEERFPYIEGSWAGKVER